MRYHCNRCGKDFTIIRADDKVKFAFAHMTDKMQCQLCGAKNQYNVAKKSIKKSRGRWQGRRPSIDTWEYSNPVVEMHSLCQQRVAGSMFSKEGMQVMCNGCPSYFNCYTGNIDDGIDVPEESKEKKIERAKEELVKIQSREFDANYEKIRKWGKLNMLTVELKDGVWRIKYAGTIWKLLNDDIKAIREGTWQTKNTTTISRTLERRNISVPMARSLVLAEIANNKKGKK